MWTEKWFPHGNGAANAVSFFFILSGLVTGYSSFDKHISFSYSKTMEYVSKKLKKVYPLYFITTILAISYSDLAICIANHAFSDMKMWLIQLIKNLLLIQSWFQTGYFSYNGVGWFLSSIMFLYLLKVPITACASKIKENRNNILIFCGICFPVSPYGRIYIGRKFGIYSSVCSI